jgi:cytochrome c oxidase assembly protein subunit 11
MTNEVSQNTGDNARVARKLLLVVIGMFGFGFALVPLYDVFCEVTGLNGKTNTEAVEAGQFEVDPNRQVKVEFIASLNAGMPWEFKPETYMMEVNPGKPMQVSYVARNLTDHDIIGQAVPSVSPGTAARYFQKTECFCFTEQVLKAGEEKLMPVTFIVDPNLPEDVKEISLSYTFFTKPGSEGASKVSASKPLARKPNQEI